MFLKQIEEKVYELVLPYANENGLEIYDVIYAKQGKDMYLSIYIDKESGISIEDCEKLTNYINPILDENLDIDDHYMLEVSSSGLEKNIRKEEHFKKFLNTLICIKLYKPFDKKKEFEGILKGYTQDTVTIECDNEEYTFNLTDISTIKTVYDWDNEE